MRPRWWCIAGVSAGSVTSPFDRLLAGSATVVCPLQLDEVVVLEADRRGEAEPRVGHPDRAYLGHADHEAPEDEDKRVGQGGTHVSDVDYPLDRTGYPGHGHLEPWLSRIE